MHTGEPAERSDAPRPRRRPRASTRRWTWPRRLLAAGLALVIAATVSSLVYNAATADRAREPAGLTFVRAAGIMTRYRQWGAAGPAIVLVHGFAESADTWDPVARVLAAHHRVFALDLTGWGYSERSAPYDVTHDGAQLLGLLDTLHLDRPVLVGHSTGAAVVAAATLRAPDRVGGVVFLDGDGLDTGAGARAGGLRRLLPDPYRTSLLRLAIRSDLVIRQIYGSQCGPACPRLDRAGLETWRRPLQVAGAERALMDMRTLVGLPAERIAALRPLTVPKAVIYGADDDVFSRASPYETATRIGAPGPTVIPGARHLALVSHPARVAAAVDALPARGAG